MKKGTAWALGCGIGCGLLVLGIGAAGFGGFVFLRGLVQETGEIDEVQSRLAERFGAASSFVPDPSGAIPPERVRAFLDVRNRSAGARDRLEETLSYLGKSSSPGTGWDAGRLFGSLRRGLGVIGDIIAYYRERSTGMLDAGMGPGEYLYLYVITYYAWLGKSPADGPPFILTGDDGDGHRRDLSKEEVERIRKARVRAELGDLLREMMRSQLSEAAFRAEEEAPETSADGEWLAALRSEIAAMEEDSRRIPWQEGVPDPIAASLEPFRDELGASYSILCNPLETRVQGGHAGRDGTPD